MGYFSFMKHDGLTPSSDHHYPSESKWPANYPREKDAFAVLDRARSLWLSIQGFLRFEAVQFFDASHCGISSISKNLANDVVDSICVSYDDLVLLLQAYLKRDFIRSTELWEKALFSVKGLDTLPEAYKVPLLADLQLYSRKYLAISWVSTENTSSLSAGVDVLRECCQCIPDWQTFFYHGYAEISMGHVREAEQVLRGAYEFFAGPDHLDTRIIIGALEGALALKEGDYLKAEQR